MQKCREQGVSRRVRFDVMEMDVRHEAATLMPRVKLPVQVQAWRGVNLNHKDRVPFSPL